MTHRFTSRTIIAAFIILFATKVTAAKELRNPIEIWTQEVAACLDKSRSGICRIRIYELEIEDPADNLNTVSGSKMPLALGREDLPRGKIPRRQTRENSLTCRLVTTGEWMRCIYSPKETAGSSYLPFVLFLPPYTRAISDSVSIVGAKYNDSSVNTFWKEWVKYSELGAPDKLAISRLINSTFGDQGNCEGQETCERYNVLRTPDGIHVIGRCQHNIIEAILGPPRHGTCKAEVAIIGKEIWILASTKILAINNIPACGMCAICCAMAMTHSFDFSKKESFLKQFKDFVLQTVLEMKEMFKAHPWLITKLDFSKDTNEFQAVSGRRKSNIIDGFEDLYLHVRPIVRLPESTRSRYLFGFGENEFQKLDEQGIVSQVLSQQGGGGLDISVHLEIYRSKYNTMDDSYWIRPTKEQEQNYREKMSEIIGVAAEKACKKVGLQWNTHDNLRPMCTSESLPEPGNSHDLYQAAEWLTL